VTVANPQYYYNIRNNLGVVGKPQYYGFGKSKFGRYRSPYTPPNFGAINEVCIETEPNRMPLAGMFVAHRKFVSTSAAIWVRDWKIGPTLLQQRSIDWVMRFDSVASSPYK